MIKPVKKHVSTEEKAHSKTPILHDKKQGFTLVNKLATISMGRRVAYGLGFAAWVAASFIAAQYLLLAIVLIGVQLNISLPVTLNETVFQTVLSVFVYILALLLAIGLPWRTFGWKITRRDLGLEQTLPRWRDIALAPAFLVLSLVATGIVMFVIGLVLPVDVDAEQQIGFENISQRYEMLLAFFTLVILAPICEEVLFRGYLYGQLRRFYNTIWTIALSSLVFGAMHLYAGPDMPLQWNVMIGTVVLAVFIGALRAMTGSIWAGILLHMLKNAVAFFLLFVAPLLGISMMAQ